MTITFLIEGQRTKISPDLQSSLKSAIQMGLDSLQIAGKPEDYISVYDDKILDPAATVDSQIIKGIQDNRLIGVTYVIHRSRSRVITLPVNPYKGNTNIFR